MTGPDPDPDDPYRYTDHPLLDLPAEPPSDLLTEMTTIIDKLCRHPRYSEADLPIAFRQVQKRRCPKLTNAECADLFAVWVDTYQTRQDIKTAALRADMAELLRERDALFSERASASPDAIARIDVRLRDIGNEIASAFEARDGRAIATWP